MWRFQTFRRRAIEELQQQLAYIPATRVVLSTAYHIDDWMLPALHQLARRDKPMDSDDVRVMGLERVLKISQVRERYVPPCAKCLAGTLADFLDVEDHIVEHGSLSRCRGC